MFHKRLLKEFKENKKLVIGMVASQWIMLCASVILNLQLAGVISGLLQGSLGKTDLYRLGIIFFAVLIIRSAMTALNQNLSVAAAERVKHGMREKIYQKIMELGSTYRNTITTSEAVQISTEGVEQLEIYFGKYIPQFFYSMLAPLSLFLLVGFMNLKIAVVLLICVPLIPMSIVAVQKFAKKMLAKYWGTYTELGDSFLENLQGLTTMKIYQTDDYYAKKMDEESEKFRKVTMRVLIMQLNSISIMDLVAYGGAAVGIILSILEYQKMNITLSQCFFIIMISAEFFLPLRLLGSFFHIAMNGNAAADKIFRLLDANVPEKGSVTEIDGNELAFHNVSFSYTPEKRILKDISFQLPDSGLTALVGMSGSGKSTIASLIMKNELEYQGKIEIGGNQDGKQVSIADVNELTLNKKITRIRHDSYLFQGTIAENLRFGKKDATEQEMWAALEKVDLAATIREKGGLSVQITEKAANLSGGQKQRLALARAILHDSDIYIFDEATSNIDVESENKIMEVVKELAEKKNVLLISHRLANVVDAGQILVLLDGSITERGRHEALMAKKGYYYQLFSAQQELEKYNSEAMEPLYS